MTRIIQIDGKPRLDSGITVDEAVREAEIWWDTYARHMVKRVANSEETKGKFIPASPAGPAIVIRGEKVTTIHSGVLEGKPWAELKRDEKLRVVKVWDREVFQKREQMPEVLT